jgi:cytochrome b
LIVFVQDLSQDMREEKTPAPMHSDAPVLVWDLPLRLVHWATALCVLTAWFTPNTHDTLHRSAGYGILGLTLCRLLLGFFGTRYSRFQNPLRVGRALPRYLASLLRGRTRRYLGLNPAGSAMSMAMLLLLAISSVSGWMQVTLRFFGVAWVQDTHTYASYSVIALAAVHVLGVLYMSVRQKENLVRAMISGWKRSTSAPGAPI